MCPQPTTQAPQTAARKARLPLYFRGLAAAIALLTLGLWLATGSHTGWTKQRVEIAQIDPITEIEYTDYEERFVMGVDYLAVGLATAAMIVGASFFIARRETA